MDKKNAGNGKSNGGYKWSPEEIQREKKDLEKVRKIFISKGITGDEACKLILQTRRGQL